MLQTYMGLSTEQAAQVMGISTGAARSHLAAAMFPQVAVASRACCYLVSGPCHPGASPRARCKGSVALRLDDELELG